MKILVNRSGKSQTYARWFKPRGLNAKKPSNVSREGPLRRAQLNSCRFLNIKKKKKARCNRSLIFFFVDICLFHTFGHSVYAILNITHR